MSYILVHSGYTIKYYILSSSICAHTIYDKLTIIHDRIYIQKQPSHRIQKLENMRNTLYICRTFPSLSLSHMHISLSCGTARALFVFFACVSQARVVLVHKYIYFRRRGVAQSFRVLGAVGCCKKIRNQKNPITCRRAIVQWQLRSVRLSLQRTR